MKDFISKMLSEDNGRPSSMRVYCFLALIMAMALSVYSIYYNTTNENLSLIISWMSAAFAGKVGQKAFEKSDSPKPKKTPVK